MTDFWILLIIYILIFIVVLVVIRTVVWWYFGIYEAFDKMDKTNKLLEEIRDLLKNKSIKNG